MSSGATLLFLSFFAVAVARSPSSLEERLILQDDSNGTHSLNVSSCPGYTLSSLEETSDGLTASLTLAGEPCNAFGQDVSNLTIEVTYETADRLHVLLYDTVQQQFTIPETVISRPNGTTSSNDSDLEFNYDESPFAFWISRKSDPNAAPLFDTRSSSLPVTPIPPVVSSENRTALDGFSLVFEDQYLQLTSALPHDTNIYGLGETIASSGFRRDMGANGTSGTIQTLWARDVADPVDENIYGSHPFYLEHRYDANANTSKSHGVFLMSSAGADILLLTPPGSNVSLIEYRMIGGVLDFYFLSGPSPQRVVEQYGELIGLPTWQPEWGFGFMLCRWGYTNVSDTRDQVTNMRNANIPLEVMWNDIDLYHAVRDFTNDPVSFPAEEMKAFIDELASNNQRYIPIVDAAIPKQVNDTDIYDPYTEGVTQQVFITNPDGSEYVGQVWPGYTVFPDWFANNTQDWWIAALKNWSESGIQFSGIWLDMNEASSFCDGSCGSNADLRNTSVPFFLPGTPENLVLDYPECYDSGASGPSGNMTINGFSTNSCSYATDNELTKRGLGAANQTGVDLNTPPYAIKNGFGRLSEHALATNATHAPGYAELDVHNLWGLMEEKATHNALQEIQPGERPFIISRSTFASSGKWTGHWLGDNFSKWEWMYYSIQGVLQFQLFQIPFVGPDTCGFNGNTDEELCNRWMMLSAFFPFYRNHNILGAISQEPYRWDSVANASRTAISTRYSLLPYWYTLFANSSLRGTPPMRALFFEFPDEPELFGVDQQFLVGRDILVTPVLTPGSTTVEGFFPGNGRITWRDWFTHEAVDTQGTGKATLDAPLSTINVHIRDGSALLLYANPAYTTTETRAGNYTLLVSLDSDGSARGQAYIDDGISYPPGENRIIDFVVSSGTITMTNTGTYEIQGAITSVVVLGLSNQTETRQMLGGGWEHEEGKQKLVNNDLNLDLNGEEMSVSWIA